MNLLTTLFNWAQLHQAALLSLLGGAAGISVVLGAVLLKVKNKWATFAKSNTYKKVAYALLHVFTILSTLATYWLAHIPSHDLLPVYATLTIAAQTWHRYAVSGFFSKVVVPFLQWKSETKPAVTPAVESAPGNVLL